MRWQAVVMAASIGLAGCGGHDDQLDREQLVPKGMRRTTVTAHDARTQTSAPPAPAAREPETAVVETAMPEPATEAADSLADLEVAAAADLEAAGALPPAAAVSPPAAAPPAAGAFVVQAGAFKQMTTAEGVAAKLEGLGLAARIESVQASAGTLHRVVVPGLADRAAAVALAARLKQELGIDAVVRSP
jgi:cell division protein FtsN